MSCQVAGDREVEFDGEITQYVTLNLLNTIGKDWMESRFWLYEDETLTERQGREQYPDSGYALVNKILNP